MSTQRPNTHNCVRCDAHEDTQISLACNHRICVVCLSYISIKAESKSPTQALPSLILCPCCQQESLLDSECMAEIKDTIEKVLVPRFHQSISQQINHCSIQEEQEEEQDEDNSRDKQPEGDCNTRITEVTTMNHSSTTISLATKSIGSKCSSTPLHSREYCASHPFEEVMFSCLDCGDQFLCLRCYAGADHKDHNIRSIKKTLELLEEKVGVIKVEIGEKLDLMQLSERRLGNRRQFIKTRLSLSQQRLSDTIEYLVSVLRKKEEELRKGINSYFEQAEARIEEDLSQLKDRIEEMKDFEYKLSSITPHQRHFEFIRFHQKLQSVLHEEDHSPTEFLFKQRHNKELVEVSNQQVIEISNFISRLTVQPAEEEVFRLLKERIDTVPTIKTCSHQKVSKTEKTEPEEGRLKVPKAIGSANTNPSFNQTPSYVSNFLSRQLSCKNLHERYQLQNSYSTSKLGDVSLQHQSFTSPSKTPFRDRKQRRTTGVIQVIPKTAKPKTLIPKKLKKCPKYS